MEEEKRDTEFPVLTDDQIAHLAEQGRELSLETGDVIFREGEIERHFFVLLDGELKITRRVGGEDIVLAVHHPGEFTGALALLTGAPSMATGRATRPSRVLAIESDVFRALASNSSPLRDLLIPAMARRLQTADSLLQQREKMAALGKLSAGLAHELNNPASAARRAASSLRATLALVQQHACALYAQQLAPAAWSRLIALGDEAKQHAQAVRSRPPLDPLEQSDREDELITWLDAHGVGNGWERAATLVNSGLDTNHLDPIAHEVPAPALGEALGWLEATLLADSLIGETEQSAGRISELVQAVKAYSYLDQAPHQDIDVREGLENTLTILGHKLRRSAIAVTRDYLPNLPRITAYGSELNQVWTNLLDNAIDAIDEANRADGRITIRTDCEGDEILVEVGDNGPGIPPAIQARIFDPFFTTKPVGEGTGLGLDTSFRIVKERHKGTIRVLSEPGDTRFQVRLPVGNGDPAGD